MALNRLLLLLIISFFFSISIANDVVTKYLDNNYQGNQSGFNPYIKIAILLNKTEFVIEGDAIVKKNDSSVGKIQGKYTVSIASGGDSIKVGKEIYYSNSLKFIPKFSFVSVEDRIFRGSITVHVIGGKLTVVNDIHLEDYVKGVVNKEILPSWPLEAKKVQAVLARTYAIYKKMNRPRSSYFDLKPSVLDQVYGGLGKEDLSANEAVNITAGEIITYNNHPARIYFHSTCGGSTASAKEVWGNSASYLRSVKCSYCKSSSLYRWKRVITMKSLNGKLKKHGIIIPDSVKTISVVRGKNRVKYVKIGVKNININKFRSYVGFSYIWSNDFAVKMSGGKLFFSGKGAGHGVGACQWGVAAMSKKGQKYDDILNFYFPGTLIKRIY